MLHTRWIILAVLFFARFTMAFQYQAVAALSPEIMQSLAVSLVDIGVLIGLYLGPGIVVALAGGSVAARFGDKRVVGAALLAMLAGGAIMGAGAGWEALVAGRILAGVGGVVINVVMTKMLVDWFTGVEISTALALFISSWPLGIAAALIVLPGAALAGGLTLGWAVVTGLAAAAAAVFWALYRPAPHSAPAGGAAAHGRLPWVPLLAAAMIWALYNSALVMVFGFGGLMLLDRGVEAQAANFLVSVFVVFAAVGIPLGGVLADRARRRDAVLLGGLTLSAAFLPAALIVPLALAPVLFAAGGLAAGLAAGPNMALPSQVLSPAQRAVGMGVFFTPYYVLMLLVPIAAGKLAEYSGSAGVTFWFGCAMLLVAIAALGLFRCTA